MKKRKAFTLVELLVIIGIVAVLAAIVVTQVTKYKIKAYNSAAISDLKTIMVVQEAAASMFSKFLYMKTWGVYGDTGLVRLYYKKQVVDSIRLSTNVGVVIRTNTPYYTTFCAVTKHKYSDTYFGAEPDVEGIFYAKEDDKFGVNVKVTDCPKPDTPGEVDFVPGAAGHDWQKL